MKIPPNWQVVILSMRPCFVHNVWAFWHHTSWTGMYNVIYLLMGMNIIVWYLCTSWLTNYEYLWFFWSLDSSLAGRFQVWVSFLVEVSFLFVLEKEFSESLLLRNKPSYLCKIQTTLNVCTADLCKVQALWERRSAIERRYKYHQQNVVVQWLVHLRRVNTQFVGLKFTGYGQIHTRTYVIAFGEIKQQVNNVFHSILIWWYKEQSRSS